MTLPRTSSSAFSRSAAPAAGRRERGRGFTLVEAAISTVVVAVMLTAALSAATTARMREQSSIDRQHGFALAEAIMAEVLDKKYEEPDAAVLFGREGVEVLQQRSTLDDVDDYNGLREAPPLNASGSAIAGYARWSRYVDVRWVTSTDLRVESFSETGLKKIDVEVRKNGVPVARICAVRSKARDAL
jgi:MSHA pilin protein MshD